MKLNYTHIRCISSGIAIALSLMMVPDVRAQIAQEQKITASDAISLDSFGESVSLSGDRAVVGAPGNDDSGLSSGSAYVYERQEDGSWPEVIKLTASDRDLARWRR